MNDPEYQARRAATDAERELRAERSARAQQPILAELAAVGVQVDSVWNLYRVPDLFLQAVPVLLDHLTREYPDRVLEGVARAFDNRAARPWWDELKAVYLSTDREAVRDGLAAAMSGMATRVQYEDMLQFVRDRHLGESRIYFLRAINRIGNRLGPGVGREVIRSLSGDAVLAKEAAAIMAGKGRNQ